MQASVHSFDPATGGGSVLLDTGRLLPFAPEVFDASGLRLLRLGQRVSVEVSAEDPEAAGAQGPPPQEISARPSAWAATPSRRPRPRCPRG